jgi:uncharacterized membrane protein
MVRSFIHLLTATSNWPTASIDDALQKQVHAGEKAWYKFIRGLILSVGLSFFVAGVVFFFAFNWEHLHRFTKLALAQALFVLPAMLAWWLRHSPLLHKLLLTAAAVMIGVVFAVFGQIYQTGANAYDFFLSWWLCVLLFTIYLLFEPMWLLMIVLANTSLFMYMEQESTWLKDSRSFIAFVLLNVLFYLIVMAIRHFRQALKANWLLYLLTIWIAGIMTVGFAVGLFTKWNIEFLVLVILQAVLLLWAIRQSLRNKDIFLMTIVGLSLMLAGLYLINKIKFSEVNFLLSGLWIIGSLSFLVSQLVHLQKKWRNE